MIHLTFELSFIMPTGLLSFLRPTSGHSIRGSQQSLSRMQTGEQHSFLLLPTNQLVGKQYRDEAGAQEIQARLPRMQAPSYQMRREPPFLY